MTFARLFATPALTALALLQPAPPRAELFAPGVISTRDYERDGAFTPDGKTFYFTKRTMWPYFSAICVSHLRNGKWSEPEVASFSGQYGDATPFVSRDGNRLYFASRRPVNGALRASTIIWIVTELGLEQLVRSRSGCVTRSMTRKQRSHRSRRAMARCTSSAATFAAHIRRGETLDRRLDDARASRRFERHRQLSSSVRTSIPTNDFMIVSVIGREDALHYGRGDLSARGPVRARLARGMAGPRCAISRRR